MNKVILGSRYYNWINDEDIEELKVIKLLGPDKYRCKCTLGPNKGTLVELTTEELCKYTRLVPDGYITFNIATLTEDLKDVIILLSKTKDIDNGDSTPYAVCRQNVNDLFYNINNRTNKQYFGISVSKDTCPADIDYTAYLGCSKVDSFDIIAVYIGDTLKSIMSLFKHKNYDNVLYNLFTSRCKYISNNIKYIINKNMQNRFIDGFCKTLNDLVEINNFEYDFYRAFNIIPLTVDLTNSIEEQSPQEALTFIMGFLGRTIDKSIVIPYDKSIDLSKIERQYVLVADAKKHIYIIAYTDIGKYIIPNTSNILDIDNIQKAYANININMEKYI